MQEGELLEEVEVTLLTLLLYARWVTRLRERGFFLRGSGESAQALRRSSALGRGEAGRRGSEDQGIREEGRMEDWRSGERAPRKGLWSRAQLNLSRLRLRQAKRHQAELESLP